MVANKVFRNFTEEKPLLMLGHILGILLTIGLVVLLYNELIKPIIRNWRKRK